MRTKKFSNFADIDSNVCIHCPCFFHCTKRIRTRQKSLVSVACEVAKIKRELNQEILTLSKSELQNFVKIALLRFSPALKSWEELKKQTETNEFFPDSFNFSVVLARFFSDFDFFVRLPLNDGFKND